MAARSKSLSALTLSLFLAACATTPEPKDPKDEYPDYKPEPQVIVDQPEPEQEPEQTSVTAKDPAPELLKTSDLAGLEPVDIQSLLGPVSLKRWEGDVQVMQFKSEACVIDIYFYESAPGQAFEASYFSARDNEGVKTDPDQCLAALLGGVSN